VTKNETPGQTGGSAPTSSVVLTYAAMGLYVFPCAVKGRDKTPLVKWGDASTTDPGIIRGWWDRWPDACIGVDCGKSGLIVVDLDVKDGIDGPGNWKNLVDGHDVPATFYVRTPSKGWHLWFRDPGGKYRLSAGKVAPAVDVRAGGGFVVAPGSPGYHWHAEAPLSLDDIPAMPDGIIPASNGGGTTGHWKKLDRGALEPRDLAALEALEGLGGQGAYLSDGHVTVTRPGKIAGASASIGFIGPGIVKVFTPNWPPLEEGNVYDADQLVALAQPRATAQQAVPQSLGECHKVFRRWFGDEYDLDVLDVMLCALAAERLSGDPLWVLIISGPGAAKTETVQACAGAGALIVSTVSGDAALLSGSPKKDRAKNATGGLLCEVGDQGVLAIKDVTSILSMSRDRRAEVLAALREIYDGYWVRRLGVEGGRSIPWKGRIAVIGAVTTAWDTAHAVISALGDRFVTPRLDSTAGRQAAYRRTMANTGDEVAMRAELAAAVGSTIAAVDSTATFTLTEAEIELVGKAADLVTLARTGVEYDYKGDVIGAHAPEMPTRFARQIQQIVRGGIALGMSRPAAMRLAIRAARDSMPPIRLAIADDVAANRHSTPNEIRRRVDLPWRTVDRECQALHMLGVLECDEVEYGTAGKSRWYYSLAEGIDPTALQTPPDLALPTLRPTEEREDDLGQGDTLWDHPAKSGGVSAQVRADASCLDCGKPIPEYQVGKRDGRCVSCHYKQQQAS
jgi:hypothetical protein